MKPIEYQWAHAANDLPKLQEALNDIKINAIEADIIYSDLQHCAVMGHPPATDGTCTLAQFCLTLRDCHFHESLHNVVKLDFKCMQAFQDSQRVIRDHFNAMAHSSSMWLNADLCTGPGDALPKFEAKEFLRLAHEFPGTILSIGWTTALPSDGKYTSNMVEDMMKLLVPYPEAEVTFPIRATSFQSSWSALQRLYERPHSTITLWWSQTTMSLEDLQWVYETLEKDERYRNRTYYDINGISAFLEQL